MIIIEIRQMATAYLFRDNKVLMMKKFSSKLYNSEFWSGLGGHLEPEELNHPKEACQREIHEESGISKSELLELSLRYILIRLKEDEIRQQYVYFGKTNKKELIASEEGELFWINIDEVMGLHLSRINKFMIEHYLENPNKQEIIVGTITINSEQEPEIQWSELRDPMIF
ncbi:NUDIX domain-containing protein [Cohnella sp.]|uniref:NUDIX domain-containing protein n=1 Tax=Cohnella sp. TaxID=1883426 RepID=UPI00356A582B